MSLYRRFFIINLLRYLAEKIRPLSTTHFSAITTLQGGMRRLPHMGLIITDALAKEYACDGRRVPPLSFLSFIKTASCLVLAFSPGELRGSCMFFATD
jgi:hypothetical protein